MKSKTLLALSLLLAWSTSVFAFDPGVGSVMPRGGQRGAEVGLTLGGRNLADAQEVLFFRSGLTVKELTAVSATELKVKIAIAPDAPLGEHQLRVRTATGVSDLRTFWVGALPLIDEVEPNTEFTTPQKIELNVTVNGVVDNEDVDHYTINARKGERISAEIEGIRIGDQMFDPYLAILDTERFELAASDDTALLMQDPVVSCIAPADGAYVIQVRESSYGGNGNCRYRLHIGHFPRPMTVYPVGGKAGEELSVQFLGDVTGPITQSIRLPAEPVEKYGVFADQNGQLSPSPCAFRVSTFGNVLEQEPNNDAATATVHAGELPFAFNGVIAEDKDVDWFRFTAKKGVSYDINVFARRVRSPLDAVLVICNKDGGGISSNDDSGGPDSYVRFQAPEDGEYTFQVYDHLQRGSADSVYRVEIEPVKPSLYLTIPNIDPNGASQERQTIVVPRGNRVATLLRVNRTNFGGPVAIEPKDLPAGITVDCENVDPNLDVVPVVFEAAAEAPIAGKLIDLQGKALDPNAGGVTGGFFQPILMVANGNQAPFYKVDVNRVAVAVAGEAKYSLKLEQPKIPLVQNGQLPLKVILERKEPFDAPVRIQLLFAPPGVGAGQVEIPAGQTEVVIPLNASGDAAVRKWKTCVLASCDLPEGRQWISSQMIELEVAPSIVNGKIDLAATEQGKPAQVLVHLEQKTPFEGEAMLKLVGLPNGATAEDLKIKATDKEVVFNVATSATDTPVGQHNTLFCSLTLPMNEDQIVQSLAAGGVLRIDAPPPPKADEPAPAPVVAAAQPEKPPEKVLTRLEQLRLEQQKKAAGE